MNPFARSLAAFGLGALCSAAGSLTGTLPGQGGMAQYTFDTNATAKNACGDGCEQSRALFTADEPEDASAGGSDPQATDSITESVSPAFSP